MEAPRPLVFAQNDTQTGIKLQKTPRDGAEHRKGKAEAEGTGGIITRRHHSRLAVDLSASQGWQEGGGMRLIEAVRDRKGPLDGRNMEHTGT